MIEPPNAERLLSDALRGVVAEESRLGASPAVEARVMAEFRTFAAARRRRVRLGVAASVAAAILVGAIAVSLRLSKSDQTSDFVLQTSAREVATAFMPLPYNGIPMANGQIVRLEVPRSALVSFGLVPMDGLDGVPDGTVLADVIVGDDGLARAVRFVRRSVPKEQKP